MNDELISIKMWIEKHSFDPKDSFVFLKGKTLDGTVIRSLNTKVSEKALDSYTNEVRAVQKRKPSNKLQNTLLKAVNLVSNIPSPLGVINHVQNALKSKSLNKTKHTVQSSHLKIQPSENNSIKDRFIAAAKQSKIDSDDYILMNEFALTLKNS
jgi:hypothetical protein